MPWRLVLHSSSEFKYIQWENKKLGYRKLSMVPLTLFLALPQSNLEWYQRGKKIPWRQWKLHEILKYNIHCTHSYEFHWLFWNMEVIISKLIYKPLTSSPVFSILLVLKLRRISIKVFNTLLHSQGLCCFFFQLLPHSSYWAYFHQFLFYHYQRKK